MAVMKEFENAANNCVAYAEEQQSNIDTEVAELATDLASRCVDAIVDIAITSRDRERSLRELVDRFDGLRPSVNCKEAEDACLAEFGRQILEELKLRIAEFR